MAEEKLIEAVRPHRELYDTKHADYMKTKLKSRIWDEIATEVNLKDGDDAKALWFKLRGSYRDSRRRQLKCLRSGAAPENIKAWRFQNQMSFLDSCILTGPREGNVIDSDDNSQPLPATPLSDHNLESEEIETNSSRQCERREEVSSPDRNSSLAPVVHSAGVKRKSQDMHNLFKRSLEQWEKRAKQRAEERQQLESKESLRDDPLYNFFIAMYQSTKKMPPSYQFKVRGQIFQSVSQAEEEILNIPSRPLSSSSSYTPSPYLSPQGWLGSQTSFPSEQQEIQQRSDISGLAYYVKRFEAQ